jgi:transposase
LDNAAYQRAKDVRATATALGIELLYLPSYSPNLNLIERVWKMVKKLALSTRTLDGLEPFSAAVLSTIEQLEATYRRELMSLLTPNFQDFREAQVSPV